MYEKRAVIYCSANYEIDPKFNQAARELVRAACLRGYTIVSGGTVKGTMGVVSRSVVEFGGRHRGIIPRFMKDVVFPDMDETVWTDTMAERKEAMREGTCLAVALPGGIGTMDELMETLTLAKLKKYEGKVVAFNLDGFYEPLKQFLDHLVAMKMLNQCDRDLLSFPSTMEEMEKYL